MNVDDSFYINTTIILKNLDIPFLYILEGGYNPEVIKRLSEGIIKELI